MPRSLYFHVLGSGAFAPDGSGEIRNPAGYVADCSGELLVFDLGFGNLRQIFRAGLDPSRITHAFFSHRHLDHVGDLPALLFHFNYGRPPASKQLKLFGPRGFSSFFARLTKAHHPWLKPKGYRLEIEDLEEGQGVKTKGWTVRCREVPHSTESIAFRLESPAGSFCYTGDTGLDPGLALFARGVDLFVSECTLSDSERSDGHLKVSDALALFRQSGAKRGLMTHLSAASHRELMKRKPANVQAASDLLKVRVGR